MSRRKKSTPVSAASAAQVGANGAADPRTNPNVELNELWKRVGDDDSRIRRAQYYLRGDAFTPAVVIMMVTWAMIYINGIKSVLLGQLSLADAVMMAMDFFVSIAMFYGGAEALDEFADSACVREVEVEDRAQGAGIERVISVIFGGSLAKLVLKFALCVQIAARVYYYYWSSPLFLTKAERAAFGNSCALFAGMVVRNREVANSLFN